MKDEHVMNEPAFPYRKIFPSTLDEQEDLNRRYSLSLTAEERLAYLLILNLNAYGKETLLMKDFGKRIVAG